MNNRYRIKLEIKLKDLNKGQNSSNYELIIKVLKKDNRFDIKADYDKSGDFTSYSHLASNGFKITTSSHIYKGFIGFFSFIIPSKKYMNRKIISTFRTDELRKTYLKGLHDGLMDWANNYGAFKKEPDVKFKSIGSKWYFYITK